MDMQVKECAAGDGLRTGRAKEWISGSRDAALSSAAAARASAAPRHSRSPARGSRSICVARTMEALESTAAEIERETGSRAIPVPGDITDCGGRAAVLSACPEADILVTNPGVRQTPADFRTMPREEWLGWLDAHFFSALEMIRGGRPGHDGTPLRTHRQYLGELHKVPAGRFRPQPFREAGAGGCDCFHGSPVDPAQCDDQQRLPRASSTRKRSGPIFMLMPSGRTRPTRRLSRTACAAVRPGRFADPQECGDLIAFLCSAQSGFMTGQNIVNDGGVYQGLF